MSTEYPPGFLGLVFILVFGAGFICAELAAHLHQYVQSVRLGRYRNRVRGAVRVAPMPAGTWHWVAPRTGIVE